jgi:hypothetical protein
MQVPEMSNTGNSQLRNLSSCETSDARKDSFFLNFRSVNNLPLLAAVLSNLILGTLLFVIVAQSWASAPFWDQWGYEAEPLMLYFSHHLTLHELLSQHNESRLFVPRVAALIYAPLTRWDIRFEVAVTVLAILLVSIGIHILILRNTALTARQKILCLIFCCGATLQTTQWEVLLFGAYYFVVPGLALIWSLVIAGNQWRFPLKVFSWCALSIFATLSYINGVMLWVLLFPCLLFEPRRHGDSKQGNRLWVFLYCLIGAITLGLYFHGYHHQTGLPTTRATLSDPLRMLAYYLYWISAPIAHFSPALPFSASCGAALLLIFLVPAVYLLVARGTSYRVYNFYSFLTIGAYSLLTGLSITVGRSAFGVEQAFSSRYQVFSLLLPAILLPLLFLAANTYSNNHPDYTVQWSQVGLLYVGAAGILLVVNFINGSAELKSYGKARHEAQLVVAYSTVIPDNPDLQLAFPVGPQVARICRILAPFHLPHIVDGADRVVAAAKNVTPAGNSSNGFLDKVADGPGNSLLVTGWAILNRKQKPADAVLIEWKGRNGNVKPLAILPVEGPRPDIANAFGDQNLSSSGFSEAISKANIPGPGVISAWAVNQEQHTAYQLATTWPVAVPGS